MMDALLSVNHLNAWYGKDKNVLSDFSLELMDHETVGLIGLNGAGKTTLLKVLSGLHAAYSADSIRFCGKEAKLRGDDFKTCRYTVFDEDHAFSYFTFREYASYVFSAYGHELPELSELMRGFHFEDFADVRLKDLSTGNRKKAFLITAFALRPRLLLLDEPVNGLDFLSTEYLYEQIAGYREYGTVLYSSHILESITEASDRVVVLQEGRLRLNIKRGAKTAEQFREVLRYERVI